MDREPIEDVIGRVLTHQTKDGDQELLEIWISESESNRQQFILMKESWDKTRIKIEHPNADELFRKLQSKISLNGTNYRKSKSGWIYGVAASVALLVVSFFFIADFKSEESVLEKPIIETIRKVNPNGQKSRIHLPDGSTVSLNSGSSIEYTLDFNASERIVHLTGEAFFEVKKAAEKPFKVIAGGVVTTALGTSFDVRAFPNAERVYVSLVTGKVSVTNLDTVTQSVGWESILIPGEQLIYHLPTKETSKGPFDFRQMINWKDGVLYFEDTDLKEVVSTLERWFGVNITLKKLPANAPKFSGEFKNESLDNILMALSYSGKIRFTQNDKEIIIECINPK
tara:strand:+ start:4102 stop:5121 length:1020 start_codon:yes stop_codon:yes gene_type:complete